MAHLVNPNLIFFNICPYELIGAATQEKILTIFTHMPHRMWRRRLIMSISQIHSNVLHVCKNTHFVLGFSFRRIYNRSSLEKYKGFNNTVDNYNTTLGRDSVIPKLLSVMKIRKCNHNESAKRNTRDTCVGVLHSWFTVQEIKKYKIVD